MQYLIGLALIIGVIALILYILYLLLQVLLYILAVGAVGGLAVGGFYGVRGYLRATRDEINNKGLKIAMIVITCVFVLALVGALVYLIVQGVR